MGQGFLRQSKIEIRCNLSEMKSKKCCQNNKKEDGQTSKIQDPAGDSSRVNISTKTIGADVYIHDKMCRNEARW